MVVVIPQILAGLPSDIVYVARVEQIISEEEVVTVFAPHFDKTGYVNGGIETHACALRQHRCRAASIRDHASLESRPNKKTTGFTQPSRFVHPTGYSVSPSFGGTSTSLLPGGIVIGTPTSKITLMVPPSLIHAAPSLCHTPFAGNVTR